MSGELKPGLPGIEVGTEVTVINRWRPGHDAAGSVVKIGRIWFTVRTSKFGDVRFRKDTLACHVQDGSYRLSTEEIRAYEQRVAAARKVLGAHSLKEVDYGQLRLHDEDLFAIAELLGKRGTAS